MYKPKILLFIKLPPPFTGATQVNLYIKNNPILNELFAIKAINASYSNAITGMGKYNPGKAFKLIKYILLLLYNLIFFRPKIIYFQISPLGKAFLRDLLFVMLIKLFHIRIIYHLHGKGIDERIKKSVFQKKLYHYAFKNEFIICLSENLKKDIYNVYKGVPYVVNNAVGQFEYNDTLVLPRGDIPQLLFLSNLIKAKGVIDYLDIIQNLTQKNIEFSAVICGSESYFTKQMLDDEIQSRNISSRIKYLGPVDGIEKHRVFTNSDIFILPTYNDTFPLVLLEAMYYGLPVITTLEGAIPEIVVDKLTGYLVKKRDIKALTEKTELLIKNKAIRVAMGIAAKKLYIDHYTLERFNANIAEIFTEINEKLSRA